MATPRSLVKKAVFIAVPVVAVVELGRTVLGILGALLGRLTGSPKLTNTGVKIARTGLLDSIIDQILFAIKGVVAH